MNKGIQEMAQPGGTPEQPQALPEVHTGELVNSNGSEPPRLSPSEWQSIMNAYDLLRTHQGRVATAAYEVSRDDAGCVHVIIGSVPGS